LRSISIQPSAKIPRPDQRSVLLVGDVQVDFCPGGALAVPGGDRIIPIINDAIRLFHSRKIPIIAIRDWHPPNHMSFKEQGGPWPIHCVQMSQGAQFHPELVLPPGTVVVSKATDPKREAYSAFEGTTLEDRLRELEAERLFITGLATDYCVRQTVLDARRLGFQVVVLEDAVRGIDAVPGDSARALEEMRAAGAVIAKSSAIGL
jgi:nicotinamidase/pyrazinamidase